MGGVSLESGEGEGESAGGGEDSDGAGEVVWDGSFSSLGVVSLEGREERDRDEDERLDDLEDEDRLRAEEELEERLRAGESDILGALLTETRAGVEEKEGAGPACGWKEFDGPWWGGGLEASGCLR